MLHNRERLVKVVQQVLPLNVICRGAEVYCVSFECLPLNKKQVPACGLKATMQLK